MDKVKEIDNGFNHGITLVERKNIGISGVKKIESFDSEEFLMETTLGYLVIKGSELEIIKLDTYQGNVSIKGKIFYILLEINYNFLFEGKIIYRIIISFLFVIVLSLVYFLILLKINNGVLHLYFFLLMFTGYLLSFVIYKKLIVKRKKVWYNLL